MTNKSFVLYVHKDLSGRPDWRKVGKSMTPYSAVRTRQKFCSDKFFLDHIFIGVPSHIDALEKSFKTRYQRYTGSFINKISGQTEMFNMSENDVLDGLKKIIKENNLYVRKIELDKPYSACNSGECPLGIPSETMSYDYLKNLVVSHWNDFPNFPIRTNVNSRFNIFFEIES